MACTKIIAIHHTLNKSLDYISDPKKTALNNDKTEQGLYISSFNCGNDTANDEMKQTQTVWGKPRAKVLGYHVMQSFKPGEVTPETAHQIGCEFVNRCLAKKYEVVVTTHLNKSHLHNHIIFNSVSFADGKMYRNNFVDYYRDIRAISDDLCKQYGLSVISDPAGKGKQYAEWKAENNGQRTWRSTVSEDVDKAIKASMSFQGFLRNLREQGYEVKTGVKHLAVRPPGKERFVRLRSLGEQYTEEAIKRRILAQQRPELLPESTGQKTSLLKYDGTFTLHKVTWKGLRALYFHYLHMLRKAQRSPNEAAFLLREDLVQLDRISDQAKLLGKNKIDTAEQLEEYRRNIESQINQLKAEKKSLGNELRRVGNQNRKSELSARISDISSRLKPLRHELKLCDDIVEYSVLIKEKEEQLRTLNKREEMKEHEPSGRGRSNREHGS
jgi:hypothetical protein